MNRRNLLKSGILAGAGLLLSPLELFAFEKNLIEQTEPQVLEENLKLTVDFYIDSTQQDPLSKSYSNDKNWIFYPMTNKIKEFYANAGVIHHLPGIDIDFNIKEFSEYEQKQKGKVLVFTDSEKMLSNYSMRDFMFGLKGKEGEDFVDEKVEELINERKVSRKEAIKIADEEGKEIINMASTEGGVTLKYINTAYVYPLTQDTLQNEPVNHIANMYALMFSHELGHLLNLNHPENTGDFGRDNLMDFVSHGYKNWTEFNSRLTRDQALEILASLKFSK